ncbi:YihY/virulence factor BrkB family protein [Nocardioides sp. KC13]|uniref:YihY/virulence factor BrkB family protein n=1 Tax=Nocardioides turkmenicus TaxID=2711220 RepID=A0A6M1RCJ4_9ACTN|nr:YihY/virulence factor BrkB family protein [Nocardioides sp. KC13]NGN94077.1 YihY/virulence factor BrkB family protein [Nocardioides sp. KC13]
MLDKEKIKEKIAELRARFPALDRAVRTQEHYGDVGAGQQAGAITYFGFLSTFPILALAFFAVGQIAKVYAGAESDLVEAIDQVLPGLVGDGAGQLKIADIERAAGAVGIVGAFGLLYAGLGFIDGLRKALEAVFMVPEEEQPGFLMAKLRDLAALILLGLIMLVAVAFTGLIRTFSANVLDWIGLDQGFGWLIVALTLVLGLAANTVLFFAMFHLAPQKDTPKGPLWAGALLGAIGFEILKQASTLLLNATQGQPAFQAFGIALILVVWIHYTSMVILYAASYAYVRATPADSAEPPVGTHTGG